MYMANHDIVLIAILRHPRIGLGIDVRSHTPPALEESRDWKEKKTSAATLKMLEDYSRDFPINTL